MKKIIYSMALIAGLSAISVGCSSEEQNLTQETQAAPLEAGKIQFKLPAAFNNVQTYAIGGTNEENHIDFSKMHALVFNGTSLKGIYNQGNNKLTKTSDIYTIDLNTEGNFRLLILANLDLSTLNSAINTGDDMNVVFEKITSQDVTGASGSFVMASALTDVNVTGAGADITGTPIQLERLAARFDFRNVVPDLEITQIKFKNRFKHSKLLAATSNITDAAAKEEKIYTSANWNGKPQTALFSVVYGYENAKDTGTEQTIFVLSGKYKNQPIKDIEVKLNKITKRNHRYLINISENGSLPPGPTPTPPGTPPNPSTPPNLKFDIEVLDWNQGETFKLDNGNLTVTTPSTLMPPTGSTPGITYSLSSNPATAVAEHNITKVKVVVESNTGVSFVPNGNTNGYTPSLLTTEFTDAGKVKQTWEINFSANTTTANKVNSWLIRNQMNTSLQTEFKLTHKGKPAGGLLTTKLSNSPIMKLSEYAVNTAGTGFVNNHDINNNQVGYFDFNQATTQVSISGYTLPTKEQWFTIIPNYYEENFSRVYYGSNNIYNNQNETNSLGTFQADYRNKSSEKTTYAVRFKNDAELKSAWRYRYVANEALIIEIIPLNNALSNKTITDVEQASFWTNNSGSIVKTIKLPLYGYKYPYNSNTISSKGQLGYFWSASPYGSGSAWSACLGSGSASSYDSLNVQDGFPIFLLEN